MLRAAVVTPVFNDWASFAVLLRELDRVGADVSGWRLSILAVDDGSTESPLLKEYGGERPSHLESVRILRLYCNVGHQRAIAIGLSALADCEQYDAVIVMDSDGEDRPEEIPGMLRARERAPQAVVVAHRTKRSEGMLFRGFYWLYKTLFRAMAGKPISFGNFMVIPRPLLPRLTHMPEVWNNLAASVTRSRLPVLMHPTVRGSRYAGQSKMNFVSLITHGLSAVSVYSDVAFVRILLFSVVLILMAAVGIGIALAIRFLTDLAVPGWTTTVVGTLGVVLLQTLMLSTLAVFLVLNGRSQASVIPADVASRLVRTTDVLI